jgi:predicted aldo/keto reductase-like oxidoreductase
MPCPNGVDIPGVFGQFNRGVIYGRLPEARVQYGFGDPSTRASACRECRECEEKCPQGIPTSEWMPYIHRVLGEGKEYDPAWRRG